MFSKFSKFGQGLGSGMKFHNILSRGIRQQLKNKLGSETQTGPSTLSMVLLGLGVGGLGYLCWNSAQRESSHTRALISSGASVSNEVALQRTKDTMMYFSGSIAITGAMSGLMLRSPTILKYSFGWAGLLLTLPGSFFCIYKMYTIPYAHKNQVEKKAYWLGFNALMAFSLVPIVYSAELLVLRDAFLITSGCFAGLGLITKNSRDDAFLGMSGFLGAGLGALVALSFANIFFQSNAIFNIWLYGGLALFLGYTLYDMKTVQVRAQRAAYFDPMTQSLGVYLDFINIFIRLVYILQGKKNKK